MPANTNTKPQDAEYAPPREPETLEQSGLAESFVEQLIIKILYYRGELYGQDLSIAIGLKFSVIQGIVETLKLRHIIHVKRSLGMGNVGAVLELTEAGRGRAREVLEANQYAGPAPVPLDLYTEIVRRQKPKEGWLTKEGLAKAFREMVVTERLLSQVGPAVSSASSFLLHGKPGDGKTYLVEQLANLDSAPIYLPFALECQGNIIQLYDPIYHTRVEDEQPSVLAVASEHGYDRRWAKCKRPFIVTGGELALDMLDLRYNATSKIYEAPFQLKANNGIYFIDDFGRQRATPAEVLNRWIVPMERKVDYLSFMTGGKMTVPFECFLVFSTNLNPADLGDEAFLRRIQYKLLLRGPGRNEFVRIFEKFCAGKGVPVGRDLIDRFIDGHYKTGKPFRRCHPRDVLSHAFNLIRFEKLQTVLTDDLLNRAFSSCFLEDNPEAPVEESEIITPSEKIGATMSCAEYWSTEMEHVPTVFGCLALAGSLRERGIAGFQGGLAAQRYEEAENARVLLRLHGRVFREWIALGIDHQRRDLKQYLSTAGAQAEFGRPEWVEALAPPDVKQEELQFFTQRLATIRQVVRPMEDDVTSVEQASAAAAPAPA